MHDLFKDFVRKKPSVIGEVMADTLETSADCARAIAPGLVDTVRFNPPALYSALTRYARDAFGCQRISTVIEHHLENLPEGTPDAVAKMLRSLQDELDKELKVSGIRISTKEPYIQKRCAILLYHLILQRPFFIKSQLRGGQIGRLIMFFNAISSIAIINVALRPYALKFDPADGLFRDLTHRTMSRSAMEAMMRYAIKPI